MKTEVYSWRVSRELKTGLEREARRCKMSLSAVLDLAAREWLSQRGADSEEAQRELHDAALACLGTFAGADRHRAETASRTVRDRLQRKYGR